MNFDTELLQVLCPFGEWNHPKGMQLVDEKSARRMKLAAMFSFSDIPVYVGHPEERNIKSKSVGRIKKICRTKGGIVVVVEYSRKAYDDVLTGKLRAMSPRWEMEKLCDGKYRPVKLLSVGLTNNPNIPESDRIIEATSMRTAQ